MNKPISNLVVISFINTIEVCDYRKRTLQLAQTSLFVDQIKSGFGPSCSSSSNKPTSVFTKGASYMALSGILTPNKLQYLTFIPSVELVYPRLLMGGLLKYFSSIIHTLYCSPKSDLTTKSPSHLF